MLPVQNILDALEGHYKPRSNEIVAAAAYKQLLQGEICLPECIEKCKEVTAVCSFKVAQDKNLQNAIFKGLRNQWVYEKYIDEGYKPTSANVIHIATGN